MLGVSVHMMQGTPYIYQGEEIGMTNPGYTSIEQYRDVESTNMYDIMVKQQGVSHDEMMAILAQKSRDNSRTPMQWNDQAFAGFSKGQPWLEVASNYAEINVENAVDDSNSVFYFYQKLIQLRKEIEVITTGTYEDLYPEHESIFGYERKSQTQTLICLNNYYGVEAECVLPQGFDNSKANYVLGNYSDLSASVTQHQVLRPYETRTILLNY